MRRVSFRDSSAGVRFDIDDEHADSESGEVVGALCVFLRFLPSGQFSRLPLGGRDSTLRYRYHRTSMAAKGIELDDKQFHSISRAIADPKRFEMLQTIAQSAGPPTCGALGESVELAPPTISHHLKELDSAGLIHIERHGKFANITLERDVWDAYLKRLSTL